MKLVRGRYLLAIGAVVLVAAGCGGSTEGEAQPVGSAGSTSGAGTSAAEGGIAADVPSGFDPCSDIPQEVLASEGLRNRSNTDSEGSNGIKWRGCGWVQSDGYAPSIRVTNITVDMVRENKGRVVRDEFTIDGREAITSNTEDESDPRSVCTLHVAMNEGSLEFFLDNPSSNKKTGHIETCQLARTLAEKVVPLIPPSS
ncbi:DUF3558 domain-containing protein [Nocardia cyriacigeorgica]|uniref:DUF3558 domain-containing protein n=1 Tax=Nocardia cyriacigeorgica TaxID=135487 RepID=UPI0018949F2E|nr:DUF3558 domain-containing protein [Nocardia cyriacigeorgica]MBF6452440.1 DUF3558 domain-containing protein [Nocardia cyriacigeorgica]MBF6481999.1 DUF3558 domain-containing protein [Nocardia cyriacigeorgica]MBF6549609.1 DUF3558 domain-containing protein [Nocardia cyriacigeorgica]